MLQVAFDSDDIFKKGNVEKEQKQAENKKIVEYKEPIIKRMFNRILKFLHLK